MRKKKKTSRKFIIFYLSFVVLMCVVCIVGLSIVDDFLTDYESSQPYKTVEKYMEKLNNGDFSYLMSISGFTATDFASPDNCMEVLEEKYSGKTLTYLESSTYLGQDKVRYNIYGDGERVGYVILTKSGIKTKYGFDTWKIAQCEPFEFLGQYTVTVPTGYTLYADGQAVGEKYVTEVTVLEEYPQIEDIPSPVTVTYKMEGFLTEPVFTVDSIFGEEYNVEVSENETVYSRKDVFYHDIYGFMRAAMEEYVHAISLETEMENYLAFVLEGSEYADTVENFNSAWIMYQPEFQSSEIEDFQILSYKEYSARQVILEVSFDYVVKTRYSSENYPSKYRVWLIKTDDRWKIANMENI